MAVSVSGDPADMVRVAAPTMVTPASTVDDLVTSSDMVAGGTAVSEDCAVTDTV